MRLTALTKTYIRRAFQFSANPCVNRSEPEKTVWYISTIIHSWAKGKFPDLQIPDKPRTWSSARAGHKLELIYDDENKYFCMLAEHPDEKYAGRFWSIEAEVSLTDSRSVLFGARVSYSTPASSDDAPVIYSIPRFVRDVAHRNGLLDIYKIIDKPRYVESLNDVVELCDFIESKDRKLPVVVISEREARADRRSVECGYLIEPENLARELWLHAHVYCLPIEYQDLFKEYSGEKWAVYDGALRTYYRNIDFLDTDTNYKHPITLPYTILSAYDSDDNGNTYIGGDAYCRLCALKIKEHIMGARIDWNNYGHSFFYMAKKKVLAAKAQSENVEEMKAAYEEQIQQLENQISEAEAETYSAWTDIERLQEELDSVRNTNYQLNIRIDDLTARLDLTETGQEEIVIPESYEELSAWIEKYYPGRLKLHSRAKQGLKGPLFEDVSLVYKSLQILGDDYYRMRTSGTVSRDELDEKCSALRIDITPAMTDNAAGEFGDEYFVQYNGKRTKIDQHVRYNRSRQPEKIMRIYFFWDDVENAVVICWLTSHLQTRAS